MIDESQFFNVYCISRIISYDSTVVNYYLVTSVKMNPQDDNSWRSPVFRQNVVMKLDEALQNFNVPTNRSGLEMENAIFQKVKTREEYLGYVKKIFTQWQLSSMAEKKQNGPDPMNALRAMTQPGAPPNPMMNIPQQNPQQNMNPASNLLQTLNQGRSTMQNRMPLMQPNVMNQMGQMQSNPMLNRALNQVNVPIGSQMNAMVNGAMPNNIPGANVIVNTSTMSGSMMVSSVNNQMGMQTQIPNPLNPTMSNQMGGMMANQITGSQMPSQIPGVNMQQSAVQLNVHLQNQRKMVAENVIAASTNMAYMQQRCPVPNQFLRQSTPPPNASPISMNSVNNMNNMSNSPGMVPSPNALQIPYPCGVVGSAMRPTGPTMVPSPSSVSLNTPGNASQMTPSPLSADEQAYRDKIKQLSKYIEPLRKMLSRSGNDHENVSKQKKLLEVLSSTGQKSTMDILLRCEAVLEKMDLKGMAEMSEQHPLVDAVSVALQNANPNHTFHRTFESVMATLNGRPLKSLPRPLKRKYVEEPPQDIPEALQGEVARLDQRFKVSLDPVHQRSSKCVYLLCWLDDRHLPCIPPVQITIPEDYPNSSPKCNLSNYEYGATKFLRMIQEALQLRISKLSSKYTMSQLLDMWENSVRETCSQDHLSNLDSLFLVC